MELVEEWGVWCCQGHSTLSSQRVFEGARLTQLVLPVTAGRLFLGHKGRVDPYMDECLYHYVWFGHKGFLLQVSLSSCPNGLEWEENGCSAEDTQNDLSS